MTQHEIDHKTIHDFGKQWTRFPDNVGWLGSLDCLRDHFGPLMSIDQIKGAHVAEVGSGSGRIVRMLLDAGAASVIAIEPSDSFRILESAFVTELDRVILVHNVGEAVGDQRNLDLVISFGVLHHIVNPLPVVKAAYRALRPGGKIAIWLYGYEGNEAYLAIFSKLRAVTKHLPDPLLSAMASVLNLALDLYIPMCRMLPLPMRDYMLHHLGKVDRKMRKVTVFDQLNPAYAKYYRQAEARALLADGGFEDLRLYRRHGYSWTVMGTKGSGSLGA